MKTAHYHTISINQHNLTYIKHFPEVHALFFYVFVSVNILILFLQVSASYSAFQKKYELATVIQARGIHRCGKFGGSKMFMEGLKSLNVFKLISSIFIVIFSSVIEVIYI